MNYMTGKTCCGCKCIEKEKEIDELCVLMIMMTTTNVLLYKVNDDGRDVCVMGVVRLLRSIHLEWKPFTSRIFDEDVIFYRLNRRIL